MSRDTYLPYHLLGATRALVAHMFSALFQYDFCWAHVVHKPCSSIPLPTNTTCSHSLSLLPVCASPPTRMFLKRRRVAILQATIIIIHHLDPHPTFLVTVIVVIVIINIVHRVLAV